MSGARYPSGKGEVCKTFIREFDSHPRLQIFPGSRLSQQPLDLQFPFRPRFVPDWAKTGQILPRGCTKSGQGFFGFSLVSPLATVDFLAVCIRPLSSGYPSGEYKAKVIWRVEGRKRQTSAVDRGLYPCCPQTSSLRRRQA
jgi:hypothetical protein